MRLRVLERRDGPGGSEEYLVKEWGKPESDEIWMSREALEEDGHKKTLRKFDVASAKKLRRSQSRSRSRSRSRTREVATASPSPEPTLRRRASKKSGSAARSPSPAPVARQTTTPALDDSGDVVRIHTIAFTWFVFVPGCSWVLSLDNDAFAYNLRLVFELCALLHVAFSLPYSSRSEASPAAERSRWVLLYLVWGAAYVMQDRLAPHPLLATMMQGCAAMTMAAVAGALFVDLSPSLPALLLPIAFEATLNHNYALSSVIHAANVLLSGPTLAAAAAAVVGALTGVIPFVSLWLAGSRYKSKPLLSVVLGLLAALCTTDAFIAAAQAALPPLCFPFLVVWASVVFLGVAL